jgi:hypothetical protein
LPKKDPQFLLVPGTWEKVVEFAGLDQTHEDPPPGHHDGRVLACEFFFWLLIQAWQNSIIRLRRRYCFCASVAIFWRKAIMASVFSMRNNPRSRC